MGHDHTHSMFQRRPQKQRIAEILVSAALRRQFMPAMGQEWHIQALHGRVERVASR